MALEQTKFNMLKILYNILLILTSILSLLGFGYILINSFKLLSFKLRLGSKVILRNSINN